MKIHHLFISKGICLKILIITVLVFISVPLQSGYADHTYSFSDDSTSEELPKGRSAILDDHMVWYASDKKGNRQIFYKNLSSGVLKQITDTDSPKESPAIGVTDSGDPIIIWTDKRNHDDYAALWDIYSYDLNQNKEKKLNSQVGQHVLPSINGNYVVWHDLTSKDMYYYDLVNEQEVYIDKGRYPIVAKNKVLYKNAGDGGLTLYTIHTGEFKKILELPYSQYVFVFTFNGESALWIQNNLDHRIKYSVINTTEDNPSPIDLTQEKEPDKLYSDLAIGDNHAAWLEDKDGVAQIMGVHLSEGTTYQVTNGTENQKLISFSGEDELIMAGTNGNIVYRTIIPVAHPANSTVQPKDNKSNERIEKIVGSEGGKLQLENGHVILNILKGTFKDNTLVGIELNQEGLEQEDGLRLVSDAWNITSDQAFSKKSTLSLSYDASSITPQQLKKIGIYSFDHNTSSWNFLGGVSDPKEAYISIDIAETGTYAAILYDKTFSDINGHWAQDNIEILASRWIINGLNENDFGPNQTLTRAQFTKMLAIAVGLDPVRPSSSTFSDVSVSHWGYEWIETASKNGLVQGSQGKFNPNEVLTREQMMTMLIRAINEEEKAMQLSEDELNNAIGFSDSEEISAWARSYVALAVEYGLVEGANGRVQPTQSSTRAMAAVVIYRLLEQQKEI